jgi:hypothetical protein
MFIQPRSMKGCQIGQGKLSIRKTSEGIGKETEERAEGKGKAKEKEYPLSGCCRNPGNASDSPGSAAREIRL